MNLQSSRLIVKLCISIECRVQLPPLSLEERITKSSEDNRHQKAGNFWVTGPQQLVKRLDERDLSKSIKGWIRGPQQVAKLLDKLAPRRGRGLDAGFAVPGPGGW